MAITLKNFYVLVIFLGRKSGRLGINGNSGYELVYFQRLYRLPPLLSPCAETLRCLLKSMSVIVLWFVWFVSCPAVLYFALSF